MTSNTLNTGKLLSVEAFAPATVANLSVGFDILGLALDAPGDTVIATRTNSPGLRFAQDEPGDGFPREIKKNTAGRAAEALLEHLQRTDEGIELRLKKGMARGTGMGSSAASAAASVVAVNHLLGEPLRKDELLRFATIGEQVADGAWHADNVAPSLLGGVILVRDPVELDFVRLPYPKGLHVALVHPHVEVLTATARAVLSDTVPRATWIAQSGDLAAFVAALAAGDLTLLGKSLRDHIIEPQRAGLVPHLGYMREAAQRAGAIGAGISGSGPSIFAFADSQGTAANVARAMRNVCSEHNIATDAWVSAINGEGARVVHTKDAA